MEKTEMKKRSNTQLLIYLICILLFAAALSGCMKKEYGLDKNKPIVISIWHYYNGANKTTFDELVSEFNETVGAEKGIIIDPYNQGSITDLFNNITASAKGKVGSMQMPDIFATYVDSANELNELGILANMDDYFTEEELSEYIPNYIEEGRFDQEDSLRVFPIAKSTELLCINKTDWDKFAASVGVTEDDLSTWEGLVSTAEKYYNWSNGKAFFGRDAFANYLLIGSRQLGTEIFKTEDGHSRIQFDEKIMKTLWDNYYIPYIKGYFYKEGTYASDDAKTGKIIAYIGSTSSASYFPKEVYIDDEEGYPIEHMFLPVPNFEGTSPFAVQQGAGMAITKSNKTQEYAASVFLKWFTQVERNTRFSLQSAYMPVKKAANNVQFVDEQIEAHRLDVSFVLKDALHVAIEETTNYELYTSKPIKNGFEARNVLERTMVQLALEDKAALDAITDSRQKEQALSSFCSYEHFKEWYDNTKAQLDEVINE